MSEEEREPAEAVIDHLTTEPGESKPSSDERAVDHTGAHVTVTVDDGLTGELGEEVEGVETGDADGETPER